MTDKFRGRPRAGRTITLEPAHNKTPPESLDRLRRETVAGVDGLGLALEPGKEGALSPRQGRDLGGPKVELGALGEPAAVGDEPVTGQGPCG